MEINCSNVNPRPCPVFVRSCLLSSLLFPVANILLPALSKFTIHRQNKEKRERKKGKKEKGKKGKKVKKTSILLPGQSEFTIQLQREVKLLLLFSPWVNSLLLFSLVHKLFVNIISHKTLMNNFSNDFMLQFLRKARQIPTIEPTSKTLIRGPPTPQHTREGNFNFNFRLNESFLKRCATDFL